MAKLTWSWIPALVAVLSVGTPADAQQAPSMRYIPAHRSNYSPRSSRTIRRILIHTIEGSEAGGISWFRNRRSNVSAHFVVSHRGRITRMLRESDRAWHAGVSSWNSDSIGIENEGYASRNNWTNAQYQALASLVRYLVTKYRIPISRTYIKGHSEVRRGKSDPGRHFDWTRFLNMVRGGATAPPPTAPPPTPPSPTRPPSTNAPVSAAGRYAVRITASSLKVRSSAWGAVIGTVRARQLLVVTQRSGDWLRIAYSGRTGWIHSRYTQRSTSWGIEVTTSSLNVRGGPAARYGRLGAVYYGQAYATLQRQGVWVLIQYDRRRGWVHSGYTRAVRFD